MELQGNACSVDGVSVYVGVSEVLSDGPVSPICVSVSVDGKLCFRFCLLFDWGLVRQSCVGWWLPAVMVGCCMFLWLLDGCEGRGGELAGYARVSGDVVHFEVL